MSKKLDAFLRLLMGNPADQVSGVFLSPKLAMFNGYGRACGRASVHACVPSHHELLSPLPARDGQHIETGPSTRLQMFHKSLFLHMESVQGMDIRLGRRLDNIG